VMSLKDQLLGASDKSLGGQLQPLVQNELDDFMVTLMDMGDKKGVLDEAFGKASIEGRLSDAGGSDPRQTMDREDMELLMQKFERLDPKVQQQLLSELQQQDPRAHAEIMAGIRLLRGKQRV